jgi:predicted nucleic acid-binding protein
MTAINISKLYLDTSVISYLASKPTVNPVIKARQIITRKWWKTLVDLSTIYISIYSIEEREKGDRLAAENRKMIVKDIPILDTSDYIERFASIIFNDLKIPDKSKVDAFHLATAAIFKMDFVVSWNFKHMANSFVRKSYQSICLREGVFAPDIVTPEELLEEK